MENRTDVVYPIGQGSSWKNNELRFSLRSIEKYGINVGKLFIVGELPDFLLGEDIIYTYRQMTVSIRRLMRTGI